MEVGTPSSDVLDMLFDDPCGLLKTDISDISSGFQSPKHGLVDTNDNMAFHNIDLGDFDLLSDDNLFESLINAAEPNSLLDGEPAAKKRVIYSDHDYIAHKSPSQHSDSGISVVSDDSSSSLQIKPEENMTDDQLSLYVTKNIKPETTASPQSSCSDGQAFDFLDMMGYTDTDSPIQLTHTVNTTTDDLDELYDFNFNTEDNISIDLDIDSLKDVGSEAENQEQNSVFVFSGATKKLIQKAYKTDDSLPFTVKDIDQNLTNFPELRLTDEEKDLLSREGVSLPTNLPLTRDEERMLKAVRRKIRNKISAKESRKRKQGYVDGLEARVKLCTQENRELQKKVESLQKQNVSLITQMKKLQNLMGRTKVPAQASTCAMVLLLSMALLVAPNLNPFGNDEENLQSDELSKSTVKTGKARNLLNLDNNDGVAKSDEDPYGVTQRSTTPWENPKMSALRPADLSLAADMAERKVKVEVKTAEEEMIEKEDNKKKKLADLYPELSRRINSEPLADWRDQSHSLKVNVERDNLAGGTKGLEVENSEGIEYMEIEVNSTEEIVLTMDGSIEIDVEN